MSEHDPLLALRDLWQRQEPLLPPDALERTDDATLASVAWLQAAWSEQRPSTSVAPPLSATHRPSPLPQVLRLAAAACWVLALSAIAELVTNTLETPSPMSARSTGNALRVASIASDRVELRHGSVRLVLLTAPHASEATGLDDDPQAQKDR